MIPGLAWALIGALAGDPAALPERRQGYLPAADGVRLYYRVLGEGDPVVVVHGGPGGSMRDVLPDLRALAVKRRLIFYDQRGGGRSDLPRDKALLDARHFVDDLEAVRRFFGLERLTLVAHSFGPVLVARYMEAHPDRVSRVVFLGAIGPRAEDASAFAVEQRRRVPPLLRERMGRLVARMQGDGEVDRRALCREYEQLEASARPARAAKPRGSSCDETAAAVDYAMRYTSRITFESFGAWDYTRSLSGVTAPLLVVWGDQDPSPRSGQEAWARALPEGRLLVVPGAGHSPHVDRPGEVFAAVESFLDGGWPAGAERP
jgi:proline iminopeptidase